MSEPDVRQDDDVHEADPVGDVDARPDAIPATAVRATAVHAIEVALVTGLSGAGLRTAAKVLEDLGWYVADNLPPELISKMIDVALASEPPLERLALVMDVRSRLFTGDLGWVVRELNSRGIRNRVLFLEAADAVLIQRFESNRRSHPLQNDGQDGTLSEGIHAERARLAEVKSVADVVVDTTSLSVHQLRRRVEASFGGTDIAVIGVTVQSFGFKYGLPIDSDLVCDVRFLPNPHWVPELREHTGKEPAVRDYVLGQDGAQDYLQTFRHLLHLTVDGYRREGKSYMTVAVGCTGGKHRSVAMTEALADMLAREKDLSVRVLHRDAGRE
ncbi:RNase adaptor protein RapZ [Rhodococcus sp. RS1C4]|nr:RNase adaptor protein RapZ [Rhodococcus sp. RS1C4]OZC53926.1 RNase adaptor protein RapZ [Rhodococcus sp. 06-621-2]OZC89324.1 RNase adaptor protein RapZ [Rhodococcus sp. 06-418-1B]OZD05508.1 RNase adaptor protein RapZ [Rhodococcus sp. 06-156-4C]OZD16620.1 RNase adaptor protein RapZ [Rhodococcus sp. 06-156-4a]OZD26478.1 RNase adaptor protein RapZ [Rhodococcus sp. 06-156-3C]OZD31874.1 RNase adaptor protein RapZ [Rhodococcus sp. 06-156-3b]OZD35173.1 RNase adaptor protein RapZ [Rhodococcus sp.